MTFDPTAIATDEKSDFYVYAWLRPCGEPFYVGKGRGGRSRHLDSKRNPIFKNIVAKIKLTGSSPTIVHMHDGLTEEEAFALERSEIAKYGRRDFGGLLCNMTDGGEGMSGYSPSAETRAKMAAANANRVVSDETRAKIGESRVGKTHSEEARAKIRLVAGNRSEETRAKMSAAQTGKSPSEETRAKLRAVSKREFSEETRAKLRASGRMLGPRSGFKGVTLKKATGKWVAQIGLNETRIHIGTFSTPEEAARAYDKVAFEAWGNDCYLNFPDNSIKGEAA